ncbi:MAG: hypothetical protein R6U03_11010, partial [Gillisia sp.]
MEKIEKEKYGKTAPLLMEIEYHTVLRTILAGTTPGLIFVDDPNDPDVTLVRYSHHLFISGDPQAVDHQRLQAFILDKLIPDLKQADMPFFRLSASRSRWLDIFEKI